MPYWGKWDGSTHLQVYHTHSIRQEFEKALGIWRPSPEDYWTVRNRAGAPCVQDPYHRCVFAETPDRLARVTAMLDESVRVGIERADAIIMTLGLVEAWRTKSGRYAACEPGYGNGGGHADSSLDVLSYEANLENLRATFDLLFGRYPDKRVVLTVPPVPLLRTFRDLDIVTANTEGKCIPRAAAARIAEKAQAMVDELLDAYRTFGQTHRSMATAAGSLERVHIGSKGALTGVIADRIGRVFPLPAVMSDDSMC